MSTMCDLVTERRFRVMGTDAHVLVVGPDPTRIDDLVSRLHDLEDRWSRFRPTSEVSRLNRAPGRPIVVSDSTRRLVARAIEAWALTDGLFDPTILRALEALGYDRTFDRIGERATPPALDARPAPGPASIAVDHAAGTVTLPPDVAFDPGGIGKGLAADLVAETAMHSDVPGVLVNVGGDLRVAGRPPRGTAWPITVHEPAVTEHPLATVSLAEGAVATSTIGRRCWDGPAGPAHHLVDPTTGRPWAGAARQVTVVAAEGWWAEAAATALIAPGAALPPDCAAIVIDQAGERHELGPIGAYLR